MLYQIAPTLAARILLGMKYVTAKSTNGYMVINPCQSIEQFQFIQPHQADDLCYTKPPIQFKTLNTTITGFLDVDTLEITLNQPDVVSCKTHIQFFLPKDNNLYSTNINFTKFSRLIFKPMPSIHKDLPRKPITFQNLIFKPMTGIKAADLQPPITITDLYYQFSSQQKMIQKVFRLERNKGTKTFEFTKRDISTAFNNLWIHSFFSWERIKANYMETFLFTAACIVYIAVILVICNLGRIVTTACCKYNSMYRVMVIRRDTDINNTKAQTTIPNNHHRKRNHSDNTYNSEDSTIVLMPTAPPEFLHTRSPRGYQPSKKCPTQSLKNGPSLMPTW
jgi:hypothetical protein